MVAGRRCNRGACTADPKGSPPPPINDSRRWGSSQRSGEVGARTPNPERFWEVSNFLHLRHHLHNRTGWSISISSREQTDKQTASLHHPEPQSAIHADTLTRPRIARRLRRRPLAETSPTE